jgi:hypothetical protein
VPAPYRARTKRKIENGVKYVKRNALAGREFASFAELEAHLSSWMARVDGRIHGTTNEVPNERFEQEQLKLKGLPSSSIRVRERRLQRRVSNDAFVDVDTVRYSVPHRLVRRSVQVLVGDCEVVVFDGADLVARHDRCFEPHQRVTDVAHFVGLCRVTTSDRILSGPIAPYSRSLDVYAEHIGGAG